MEAPPGPDLAGVSHRLKDSLPVYTIGRRILSRKRKGPEGCPPALSVSGSPGRIRTYDTLINSQLRYHCATGESVRKEKVYRV